MTLILNGTNGVSDIDGDASTPAIRGTDANTGIFFGSDIIGFSEGGTECARFNADAQFVAAAGTASLPVITTTGDVNTGIFFPAADTIAFAGGGAEAMRISSSGNVGIGTTAPSAKLHLVGTTGARIDGGAGNTAVMLLTSGTTPSDGSSISATYNGSGTYGPLKFLTSDTERMRMDSSGNLLVGTTTAPAIAGAIHVSNASGHGLQITNTAGPTNRRIYMSSGGNLYFWNGTNEGYLSSAGAWTNASDSRLKTNIRDIEYGLSTVLAAQPRHFERVDVDGTYVGFVAQELQEIIPEVVSGDPEKQLGVDYGSLVAVAFKAIQELKAINDAQASRIETLEAKVAALEANNVQDFH